MEVITAADSVGRAGAGSRRQISAASLSFNERVEGYFELTKPRITSLVVLSALAGFALGSPSSIDWAH